MRQSELKKLIKEAIADRIKMIDEAGDIAALEAKIRKVDEDIKDAMSVKTALTSMDGLKYYVSSEIISDMMGDMEASIKELQTKKKDLEDQKKAMDKNSKGPKKSAKKELDEAKKINEGLSSEIMGPLTDLAKSMNISVGELIGQIAAAAGTVGGMGAAIGSAYKSYKKGLPKGDDKKKNSNLKEEEKITAKQQFASDLQDDEDFIKFKSDAIIREPNPYFYKPWYKKKKNDDGYNTLGTYGVPNVSYNDPFINPEDFEDYDELDEARFKKGEDVGKPGKGFAKIAKSAAKQYGSKEAGQKVAGAILKKVVKK